MNEERTMSGKADAALIKALVGRDLPEAAAALEAGADPNARSDGTPALCMAAFAGSLEIAERLLDAGADIEGPCPRGLAPLSHAIENGHAQVVGLLASRGAKLDGHGGPRGMTPFLHASVGSEASALALLAAGADWRQPDAEGRGWREIGELAIQWEQENGHALSAQRAKERLRAMEAAIEAVELRSEIAPGAQAPKRAL